MAADDWLRELFSDTLDLREADALRREQRSSKKARRREAAEREPDERGRGAR
jgi:hypothetical protein